MIKKLYNAIRPNISIKQRLFRYKDLPIAFACIKAEKIDSPKAKYNVLASETKNNYILFSIREYTQKYTDQNKQNIYYNNSFYFKSKTLLPINQIFYMREAKCSNSQRDKKLILSPKEILIPNKKSDLRG